MSSTCPHNMVNFGQLAAEICWRISTGIASWQRYCSDVTQRRPTKLCTRFGRVLRCYTIYIFPGALAPWLNFARCKIHFASKSCVLLYCQRYCTALQQRASAKLYGVVQGMELPNFRRGRHLYSAGQPSRWASAHILVFVVLVVVVAVVAVIVMFVMTVILPVSVLYDSECTRGGFCNFMHLKPISRELRRKLYGRQKKYVS